MSAPTLLAAERLSNALHGISLSDYWRITSSKSDDVIWNIVLAYLNSFPLSNENELTERIKCLTGDQKVNDKIKISVEINDPFLNLKNCFKDKEMSQVVSTFKDRVEDYLKKNETQFQAEPKNFGYLQASSKLLSCNIVLISSPFPDKGLFIVFPVQNIPNLQTIYPTHISIFDSFKYTSGIADMQSQFSFCIPKEIGIEKQRQALKKILKCMKRRGIKENMILKIGDLPDITENFLISLVKNDFGQVVPFIFKSSYALLRLANAGLETDPRTKDSEGKSAFFHAFKTEKLDLVSLFYDEIANCCLQTDASILSPDPGIVENLLRLKDYLKLLEKDLVSDEISGKSRCLFEDLCRFIEFQIETNKSINNINLRINYYDHTEKEYEVLQRKEVVMRFLDIYKSYFDYTNDGTCTGEDETISRFIEFYKHKYYFDKLDFSSAVIFFDNLFLLKERLKLPNNAYLDVESNFCLFIFLRKFLEQYEKLEDFHFVSRWITFQKRLSLQSQICNFKEILGKTEVSTNNIVDNIPENDVRTLTNLPEIYGQFLIFRLQHHLNAATELVVSDLKSIAVVKRCLQVLGECCKESNFKSVQRILTLALPNDLLNYLKQISNNFSHADSDEIIRRIDLEEDVKLFQGIQNELDKLKKLLMPIYDAQKYEINQFLLLHSLKSVRKARIKNSWEKHENLLKAILPSPEVEENQLPKLTSHCQHSWKRCFHDMYTSLKEKMKNLNCNGNILDKSSYKYIIANMISAIRDVLNNGEDAFPEGVTYKEKAIEELDSHFWCLENILTVMTKDRKLAKYRRTLIVMLKNRKSLFNGIRKNAFEHHDQKEKISTNAIFKDLPVAQAGIVELQQLIQSDETGGIRQQNLFDMYVKCGISLNLESKSSTFSIENEENGSAHKKVEDFEPENEIDGEIFENSFLENMFHGSVSQETIATKDCEEMDDLCENTEKAIRTENDSPLAVSTSSCDDWLLANVYHDYPVNGEAEDPVEILEVKRKTFLELAATYLDDYKKIADSFLLELSDDSNECFHFKNIGQYCGILKNEGEKKISPRCVPKSPTPDKHLLFYPTITEEMKDRISKLILANKEVKKMAKNIKSELTDEGFCFVDLTADPFSEIIEMMESKDIDRSELLCEELEMPADVKNIILKSKEIFQNQRKISEISHNSKNIGLQVEPGQNKSVPGNLLGCLRNRIKLLKSVLIHEKDDIEELWDRATDEKGEMQVKEKIVQLYLNNSETQASVETLFFDCVTILNSQEIRNLWKKATNLVGGINLRNCLIHDQSELESLGKFLDPYDVPSELVGKILQLISDEYTIDCMQEILEQSGSDFFGFVQIMKDEKNEKFKNVREQILKCDYWEKYALLIPFSKE